MINKDKLLQIILSPHITNKSYAIAKNKSGAFIIFKVILSANKKDIKTAVQILFNVDVSYVNILNVRANFSKTSKGTIKTQSKRWKKAYVKLKKGHNINFIKTE